MIDGPDDFDRLQTLEQLSATVKTRSAEDYDFKHAVGQLDQNLEYIIKALRHDPDIWKLNRAFHVVHAPSLITIMTLLENIDAMRSVGDKEKHQINASLNRAAQLATDARHRIEQKQFNVAKAELDVLAEYAPKPEVPFKRASFVSRKLKGVVQISESTWEETKSRVTAIPTLVGHLKDGANNSMARVSSIPVLAANFQKSLSAAMSDAVAKPIAMRLQASTKALKHGVGAGVGMGVAIGVLCPPLLPLSAGGAVLAAMRAWRIEMDATQKLNEADRAQRIIELKSERSAALRMLTQGASALQMETDQLSVTVDVDSGEADAVILTGQHTGHTWSSLSLTEKAEVASMLAQGANALLDILENGSEIL
ncbi:MAG: hypothetical protein ABJL67_18730 [Sulfitobacter sp.]